MAAIPAVALPFSLSQISDQQYGPETVLYTWGPGTLASGNTPVFRVSRWNKSSGPMLLCESNYVAATQAAGVQLVWTVDNTNTNSAQGWTSGMRSGVQANRDFHVSALNTFGLTLVNSSGAAIDNFQLNYTVTVRPLTMAEKLLRGLQLSDQDQLDLANLKSQQGMTPLQGLQIAVQSGLLPRPDRYFYDTVWAGRRLRDNLDAVPWTLDSTTTNNTITLSPPNSQTVQVLEGFAIEGAPDCVVMVERDGQPNYLSFNANALAAADDAPIPLWVPSLDDLVISVSGTATTVNLWPIVANYATSERLLAHLQQNISNLETYAKVRAGWL